MCFWCHQKKGHGETTSTVRKRRIPSRVPFYSLFSIFPCVVCAYMVPCFKSYSENESRTTATVVLPSCFSIGYKFCCEKHLSLSISILCVLEEHQVPEAKMINGSICMFLLSFCWCLNWSGPGIEGTVIGLLGKNQQKLLFYSSLHLHTCFHLVKIWNPKSGCSTSEGWDCIDNLP